MFERKIDLRLFSGDYKPSDDKSLGWHDKYMRWKKQENDRMAEHLARIKEMSFVPEIPRAIRQPSHSSEQTWQPIQEKIPFRIDDSPNTIRYIAKETIGENADIQLLKSMMPRMIDAKRTGPHSHSIEIMPIIDRIKWRMKMAKKFDVPLSIFEEEHIDESSKADDLKLIEMHRSSTGGRQERTPRGSFAVSQSEAAQILAKFGCTVTARTIRNWEVGKGTPDDYTREKRRSLEAFTAWAKVYVAHEKSKLNAKKAISYRDDIKY